ncbi:MAG: hypothetical protein GF372_10665 [Candidatus Marinimicrobia bacterium]|nr:hypothetical protein [Candidatus Neomarinimicrobiota bacterium]
MLRNIFIISLCLIFFFRCEGITDPSAEFDTYQLAFLHYDYPGMLGPFLYTSYADGSEYTQIKNLEDKLITSVQWSPTGDVILLLEEVSDTEADFYLIHPDGSNMKKLATVRYDSDALQPVWGSVGKYIYYRYFTGGNWDIYQMNATTGEITQLTFTGQNENYPVCSPQAKYLAFTRQESGYTDLIVYSLSDQSETNLTKGFESVGGKPCWAPNGKTLVYRATEEGFDDYDLYRINPDITGHKQLTFNEAVNSAPSWSPDGKTIVYRSDENLAFLDVDTEEVFMRLQIPCFPCPPLWSPDGKLLVYNLTGELHVMHIESGDVKRLTDDPEHVNETNPTWSPHIR